MESVGSMTREGTTAGGPLRNCSNSCNFTSAVCGRHCYYLHLQMRQRKARQLVPSHSASDRTRMQVWVFCFLTLCFQLLSCISVTLDCNQLTYVGFLVPSSHRPRLKSERKKGCNPRLQPFHSPRSRTQASWGGVLLLLFERSHEVWVSANT